MLVRAAAPSRRVLFPVCGIVTTVQHLAADAEEPIKTEAPVIAATPTHFLYL